jgi:hypothetical protein
LKAQKAIPKFRVSEDFLAVSGLFLGARRPIRPFYECCSKEDMDHENRF